MIEIKNVTKNSAILRQFRQQLSNKHYTYHFMPELYCGSGMFLDKTDILYILFEQILRRFMLDFIVVC